MMPRSCASPGSDQIADHDKTSGDADASLQWAVWLQRIDSCDQLQSCAHSALGVVLVGLGIIEIDENAVAHVFGYEATKRGPTFC
jgi:hypothetical protein